MSGAMGERGAWWRVFDRGIVLAQIELVSGIALSASAALPDTLIACAQEVGVLPFELRLWMEDGDQPRTDWSAESLREWARRNGVSRNAGGA